MRRDLFKYPLPESLIARHPAPERGGSRLLVLDGPSGAIEHRQFPDLLEIVEEGDLLVFNNTRVIPARLFGHKSTGGRVEILVERLLGDTGALVHIRASKTPKPGSSITLENEVQVTVKGREDDLFRLQFPDGVSVLDLLEATGHMPLPPYIDRPDTDEDRERYQTVYATEPGAVAAPTAGLHFDRGMLDKLQEKGVQLGYVTLHVGAGTFQPVRVEDIRDHRMHSEIIDVDEKICRQVAATRAAGKRVIAVGTTSVRCLESAAAVGELVPMRGETDIFIYPGYRFRVVDVLLTNFHLPESTLLMLVSAFAGYRHTMAAYREAVAQKYRFFSYGDAMLITRNPGAPEDLPS